MKCRKCKTPNINRANFCHNCGAPLSPVIFRKQFHGAWVWVAGVFLFACGLVFLHLHGMALLGKPVPAHPVPSVDFPGASLDFTKGTPIEEHRIPVNPDGSGFISSSIGYVSLVNRYGKVITKIPSLSLENGLVVLPAKACIGAESWEFISGKKTVRIREGSWRSGDAIGLWYLEKKTATPGPALYPWAESQPVQWISLMSGGQIKQVALTPGDKQGFFIRCTLTDSLDAPGVFIQNDRIVGVSFGKWLEGNYLWVGPPGEALFPDTTVETFYSLTFHGGREEQFERALSMPDTTPSSTRLEAFAEGFRYTPKLSGDDTPSRLQQNSVISIMRQLTSQLLKEKAYHSIADALNAPVLMAANSLPLLMDAVLATAEGYNSAIALNLLETTIDGIESTVSEELSLVNQLRLNLYKKRVREFIGAGNYEEGHETFETARGIFPDDPAIHLMGVEIALLNGDWSEANRLLHMRNYPEEYINTANLLGQQVDDLKNQEGKVVIHFKPGSTHIPVQATLNNTLGQDFVVDTGATLVTVPASAAESLGIEINDQTPKRQFSTPGGMKSGYEVTLPSIEIKGHSVSGVKALVVDIPGYPKLGLLGLNFLNQFQMEIDNEKGVLLLTPR